MFAFIIYRPFLGMSCGIHLLQKNETEALIDQLETPHPFRFTYLDLDR